MGRSYSQVTFAIPFTYAPIVVVGGSDSVYVCSIIEVTASSVSIHHHHIINETIVDSINPDIARYVALGYWK